MNLKNGYIEMYNAPAKATEQKKSPVCATKTAPASTDTVLVAYNNSSATALDLKTFKLIYSDGTHLLGSTSGIPATDINDDTNIVIKSGNEIVFGEVIASALVSIAVNADNVKKSYNTAAAENDLDVEGIVVTATYADETTKDVSTSITKDNCSPNHWIQGEEGTKQIKVTYTENGVTAIKDNAFEVTIFDI